MIMVYAEPLKRTANLAALLRSMFTPVKLRFTCMGFYIVPLRPHLNFVDIIAIITTAATYICRVLAVTPGAVFTSLWPTH